MVDDVDQQHTVRTSVEQVIVVRVDGQSFLDKLVILASAIESASNDGDLFTEVVVMATRS